VFSHREEVPRNLADEIISGAQLQEEKE